MKNTTNFTQKTPKKRLEFYCKNCDFKCFKQCDWNRHLLTKKHNTTNTTDIQHKKTPHHICSCGKQYSHRSSLFNHKKKCSFGNNGNEKISNDKEIEENNDENIREKENNDKNIKEEETNTNLHDSSSLNKMIVSLINENKEMRKIIGDQNEQMKEQQEQMKDQHEQMKDIIPKIGNNNNNTINNKVNMNFFLNEQCKDAINLDDFVNSLKLKLEDLEHTAQVGYIDGISKVFINGLQDLDVTKRPIHCSDEKKEILYVRDKDNWEKDEDNIKIKRAISNVGKSNAMLVPEWINKNQNSTDNKEDIYWKIVDNTVVEDESKKIGKIISNLAKEVTINNDDDKDN